MQHLKQALISAILLATAVATFSYCKQKTNLQMKTFVLVHGAWQAPYVWATVEHQLTSAGQKVIIVELPAHGDDTTFPGRVSINAYRDKVIAAMSGVKGKVMLIGHSMGGVVVTAVAEKVPDQIEKLIYIGAFVPASGQSLFDLAATDKQSLLGPAIVPSKDQLTLDVVHDSIVNIFCQDATPAVQELMLKNYRPEPAIPFTNKVTLTAANYGRVDKYYIHTLLDHAIGLDLQHSMVAAAKISRTYNLNTGHSPFLSQPSEVTKLLLSITQ
jgi:pimeloyl-ACP methyl ester carboxylesterase